MDDMSRVSSNRVVSINIEDDDFNQNPPPPTSTNTRNSSGCSISVSFVQKLIAEFIGTYFLIFGGCAAITVNKNMENVVTLPGIAAVCGLVVVVMIYSVGHISGAHLNPAVTIAFATFKRFPWKQVPAYVVSQALASIVARRGASTRRGGAAARAGSAGVCRAAGQCHQWSPTVAGEEEDGTRFNFFFLNREGEFVTSFNSLAAGWDWEGSSSNPLHFHFVDRFRKIAAVCRLQTETRTRSKTRLLQPPGLQCSCSPTAACCGAAERPYVVKRQPVLVRSSTVNSQRSTRPSWTSILDSPLIVASGTLRLLFMGKQDHFIGTLSSGSDVQSFMIEFITTFYLMFVISGVATDNRAIGELKGIAIGATLSLNILFAGPISGASLNPARSLGPAIVYNRYEGLWNYILAPISGAIAGAWVYNFIRFTDKPLREIIKRGSSIRNAARTNSTQVSRNKKRIKFCLL
ncbi:aquaporin NIP1-1-like [Olea europaea var. sylvestris]|uniref:aquaporin NIP1-1-like n=1 Tax=Olea europaea var. sylvestris TaxID=158386 RepID=UPI000C1D0FF3|nr:aquaporin NIP1-1-like [Olea europaea var. sylvestris]